MKMKNSSKPINKLGLHQWLEVQGKYERGQSVLSLSKEYNLDKSTIHRRKKQANWKPCGSLLEEATKEAREEVKQEIKDDYKGQAKEANDTHLKLYRAIQQMGAEYLKTLRTNMKEPDKKKRREINRDVYALQALSSTLKTAVDGERLVLNMDKIDLFETQDGFDKFCTLLEQKRKERAAANEATEHDDVVSTLDEFDKVAS